MGKTKSIDIFNIFLIIISLVIAFKVPFELFLFSYAFLGPLHYLTEITWLNEKNYFIKSNKNWIALFIVFSVLLAFKPTMLLFTDTFDEFPEWLKSITGFIERPNKTLTLIAFIFAIGSIFFQKTRDLLLVFAGSILIGVLSEIYLPDVVLFIAIFLPTIIHVYLFTLLFIFYGAIRSKSKYGIYLGILLILVPFIIIYFPLEMGVYKPSKGTIDSFLTSNFDKINHFIAQTLSLTKKGETFYLGSEIGLRIQIFIAFAYTYHYLNWFSKTSIIGWKKSISKNKAITIGFIWFCSVALYLYDFKTGFLALLLLSLLHVFLEFPLNVTTFKEVFLIAFKKKK